jgi:hypothetical protein
MSLKMIRGTAEHYTRIKRNFKMRTASTLLEKFKTADCDINCVGTLGFTTREIVRCK